MWGPMGWVPPSRAPALVRPKRAPTRGGLGPPRQSPPPLRSPAGSISAASDAALAAEGGAQRGGAHAEPGRVPPLGGARFAGTYKRAHGLSRT